MSQTAMTNIAQAAWISGCIFLTQGIVPNLHQTQFFVFKNTTADPSCLGYVGSWLGACMAVWIINSN